MTQDHVHTGPRLQNVSHLIMLLTIIDKCLARIGSFLLMSNSKEYQSCLLQIYSKKHSPPTHTVLKIPLYELVTPPLCHLFF